MYNVCTLVVSSRLQSQGTVSSQGTLVRLPSSQPAHETPQAFLVAVGVRSPAASALHAAKLLCLSCKSRCCRALRCCLSLI